MAFLDFHWNFYRIHLTFFIVHPLIWSAIFWRVNGKYPVTYTNSLFLCFSAQTVTGLSPINLSTLTGFQQAILFWIMLSGDATVISWVMVMVRRYYFIRKCAYVIRKRKRTQDPSKFNSALGLIRSRTIDVFTSRHDNPEQHLTPGPPQPNSGVENGTLIHRVTSASSEVGLDFVNPSNAATMMPTSTTRMDSIGLNLTSDPPTDASTNTILGEPLQRTYSPTSISTGAGGGLSFEHSRALPDSAHGANLVHSQAPPSSQEPLHSPRAVGFAPMATMSGIPSASYSGAGFPRTATNLTNRSNRTNRSRQAHSVGLSRLSSNGAVPGSLSQSPRGHTSQQGFGGFPTPLTLGARLAKKVAPGTYQKLERKLTIIPDERQVQLRHHALDKSDISGPILMNVAIDTSGRVQMENGPVDGQAGKNRRDTNHAKATTDTRDWADDLEALGDKVKSYVKDTALFVGRNSFFHLEDLTDEELDDVGGVEFGAIRVLSWLVPLYIIGTQLVTFIIWTAYLSNVHRYDSVFASQPRLVPVSWYSAFQAVSAFTGGGMSLVDTGMVPFIDAYPMVISLGLLIMAGNMLMPVFLRFSVWIVYHLLPTKSHDRDYFKFLLDHPRRCFLYLFPSHQTWFLVAVFFFLTAIEWGGFLAFDVGLDVYDAIPRGQRVLAGLFQSLGVRASGFSIVSLGSLAPACKLLYIIMMYISAYPIAMSLRSTNVYEERSLGVFNNRKEQEESSEPEGEVFGKYLGWHVRQQLAFDLWWLAAALLAMNVIERGNLMAADNEGWFNQFSLLFEVVSAYATIGLSLGIPTENYSLSGALSTGSKLILILVMIRGRHRDLPVAIDRAILLPEEFNKSTADSTGRHVIEDNVARQLEDEASMMSPTSPPGSPPQSPPGHAHKPLPGASVS